MAASTFAPPTILKLSPRLAGELMVRNPVSIRSAATVEEAMTLFMDRGIDAAPVIDEGGRPIGVISRSDIFVHLAEDVRRRRHAPLTNAEPLLSASVADVMTPTVFAVDETAPVSRIVSDMAGLHVHRLFVVDGDGVLVGVITAMDVLKLLQA